MFNQYNKERFDEMNEYLKELEARTRKLEWIEWEKDKTKCPPIPDTRNKLSIPCGWF